jgi:hypothetical protein
LEAEMSSNGLTRRHYRELHDSGGVEGEHPADRIVADLPEVRTVDEKVRAMSAEMSGSRRTAAVSCFLDRI